MAQATVKKALIRFELTLSLLEADVLASALIEFKSFLNREAKNGVTAYEALDAVTDALFAASSKNEDILDTETYFSYDIDNEEFTVTVDPASLED